MLKFYLPELNLSLDTSYPRDIGGPYQGVKRPGRDADHSPPSTSVEVKKE
jgi:hypothetical protein